MIEFKNVSKIYPGNQVAAENINLIKVNLLLSWGLVVQGKLLA